MLIDSKHYLSTQRISPNKPFLRLLIKDLATDKIVMDLSKDITSIKIRFIEDNESGFWANPTKTRAQVHIPTKEFSGPKDIFAVLHEIGHIAVRQKEYKEHPHRAEIKKEARLINEFLIDPEASSIVLLDEREAWTEAIKTARRYKKEYDLDLFALFPTKNDFMSWLRAIGLRSYEHALETIGVAAYSRDEKTREWFEQHKGEFPEKFKIMFENDTKPSWEKIIEEVIGDTTDSFFSAAADLKKEFEEKRSARAQQTTT